MARKTTWSQTQGNRENFIPWKWKSQPRKTTAYDVPIRVEIEKNKNKNRKNHGRTREKLIAEAQKASQFKARQIELYWAIVNK